MWVNNIRSKERDMIRLYGISKLAPLTYYRAEGIFFIDAVSGLDGRLTGDVDLLECSGIPLLEREIKRLLIRNKKNIKIDNVLTIMKRIIELMKFYLKLTAKKFML